MESARDTEDIVDRNVWCKIWIIKLNVLACADDIVLMVPSLKGSQQLIDILEDSTKKYYSEGKSLKF